MRGETGRWHHQQQGVAPLSPAAARGLIWATFGFAVASGLGLALLPLLIGSP